MADRDSELRRYLKERKIEFEERAFSGGSFFRCGGLQLDVANAERIPDLSRLVPEELRIVDSSKTLHSLSEFRGLPHFVDGNFESWISAREGSQLIDLRGSPRYVKGNVRVTRAGMVTLWGGPAIVGGDYDCQDNKLLTLAGAPFYIGGSFNAQRNRLQNLWHGPRYVGKSYRVMENALANLKGAPSFVFGDFQCQENSLLTLAGAPSIVGGYFILNNNPSARYEPIPPLTVLGDLLTEHCPAYAAQVERIGFGGEWRNEIHRHGLPPTPEMREQVAASRARLEKRPRISYAEAVLRHQMLVHRYPAKTVPAHLPMTGGFGLLGASMSMLPVMTVAKVEKETFDADNAFIAWLARQGYGMAGDKEMALLDFGPNPHTDSYVDALRGQDALEEEAAPRLWRKRLDEKHPSAVAWALQEEGDEAPSRKR